ncbi:Cleavage and polyadenylation specificity factor subunit 2 [Smittium mucronatum]|uniref:Cleavage and polyadenylation specificity factor subunit 2 n=1 Tax=Smittium mucronatum TaxID=133383 RepID=A0A1R0GL49_9FUNG|nr:Cleavage and polyadenylation specificity factor subunit 2 [Smittium mucronatum]
MSSSIEFTAFSGSRKEGPLCYLLEIDDSKLLLDCGGYGIIQGDYFTNLKKVSQSIDAVLLSHSTLEHLGGYAYAYKFLNLKCPVYATVPVYNMGKISVSSITRDLQKERGLDLSLEDVSEAFNHITTLRYSQPTNLSGKCKEINISAYSAGHSLGGSIWKIKKGIDEVLYVIDYNHIREGHLGSTSLLHRGQVVENMLRPTLLITGAYNATRILPTQKSRKIALLNFIKSHLEGTGIALVPVDTSNRILEIVYLIERFMDKFIGNFEYNSNFPKRIFLLSRYGNRVFRFARSMLEWMNDSLGNEFDGNRKNPFELKHIKILNSINKLESSISKARKSSGEKSFIVLVNGEDFDIGNSKKLFNKWASEKNNKIILTQRGYPETLTRILYDLWLEKTKQIELGNSESHLLDANQNNSYDDISGSLNQMNVPLDVSVFLNQEIYVPDYEKVSLEGEELALYKEKMRKDQEEEEARITLLLEGDISDDEFDLIDPNGRDEDNIESDMKPFSEFGLPGKAKRSSILGNPGELQRKFSNNTSESKIPETSLLNTEMFKLLTGSTFDIYFNSGSQIRATNSNRAHLFPFFDKRKRVSDYGEVLDIEHLKQPIASQSNIKDNASSLQVIPENEGLLFNPQDADLDIRSNFKRAKNDPNNRINFDYSDDSSSDSENDDFDFDLKNNSAISNNDLKKADNILTAKAGDSGYKYVKTLKKFNINCEITFFDFEGRSDGRSMHNIVAQIEPRRIVVVDGDEVSTEYFCQLCATNDRMTSSIFAPEIGEVLNVSTRAKAYSVKLSDSLLNSLKFALPKPHLKNISKLLLPSNDGLASQKFSLFSKAAISTGDVLANQNVISDNDDPSKNYSGEELRISRVRGIWRIYEDSNVPVLDLPNLEERQIYNDVKYAGDLKLSLLKRGLLANGINASFQGDGILDDDGLVRIDGNLSSEFYKIRSILYGLLAAI